MPNWITITIADLYNSKAAALIDAANSVSLGNNQTDRVTGLIADVTLEIRRKVASVEALDVDTTKIPGGLKSLAVDVIFCRLKVSLDMELSKDEATALQRREKELDRIAEGKDKVELPDNPIPSGVTMQSGSGGVTAQSSRRKATARKLGGLV